MAENWRNDVDAIADALGVDMDGNWRNDLHAIREAVENGSGGGGGGGIADGAVTTVKLADGAVTNAKITNGTITGAKIAPGTITADLIAAGVIPASIVATVCPATTVNFAFSEDGTTFSFTGGTFLWLSTDNKYGVVTIGAAINVPYVPGRILVMDVSNPDAVSIVARSINPAITFAENEVVIGNFFNYNTNPIIQTATVYGSGAYTWSATAGHHEAYGDISTSGAELSLTVGDIICTITNTGTNGSISIAARSGSLSPIDIRRFSIYADASEGNAQDGITLTTTPVVVDDTVLLASNDCPHIWVGNGRRVTEFKIFASGNGARTRIISDYLSY